jgi:hypothetical protein
MGRHHQTDRRDRTMSLNFDYTDEQKQFADSVRRFAQDHPGMSLFPKK